MKTEASTFRNSPWLAVSLGIAGMIIGYTLVVLQRGDIATAESGVCTCEGPNCPYVEQEL